MSRSRRLLLILLVVATAARAEPPAVVSDALARLGLGGSISLDYWSSDHDLDDREHFGGINLVLKQRLTLFEGVRWVAEARVLEQRLGHVDEARDVGTLRSLRYEDEVVAELREGYLEIAQQHWEVRVGRQIVVWGRADEINPTDVITPKDYLLLLPEAQSDYRFGADVLRVDGFLPANLRLTGVWVPVFSPSVIPLGETPPGVRVGEDLPRVDFLDGSAGARLDRSGGAVDASLAYFYGYNLLPELHIDRAVASPVSGLHIDVAERHSRQHMVGGDFATTLGAWGLRGEAAYVHTANADGRRVDAITPYAAWVFGVEHTFPATISVILQYVGRHVFDRIDPERALLGPDPLRRQARFAATRETLIINQQLDTWQNGWSLRVAKGLLNDTLQLELLGVQFFERNDVFVRPRIIYAVSDAVTASVGGEVFHGPKRSLFGRLEPNTGAFTELKYSF